MKRLVKMWAGATALALGVAVAPAAAVAATATATATHASFTAKRGAIGAAKVVNLRKLSKTATGRHPALAAPLRYFSPSTVAAQRAAAVRSGGRHAGLVAIAAPKTRQSVTPATTLEDFPAMNLGQQVADYGGDQAVEPPDTQFAAGPTSVVEADNDTLSVWSKTGALEMTADLNTFMFVPSGFSFTDPRVLYDAESGHWLLSGLSFDPSLDSQTYLAASATSDPTGEWFVYTVANNQSTGVLTDQPMTGVCNDKVVEGWNDYSSSGQFTQSELVVVQKSSLVTGAFTRWEDFTDSVEFRPVPAQSLAPSSTCWMVVNNADPANLGGDSATPALGVFAITGTANAGNVAINETEVPIAATSLPPQPEQPSGTTNDTQLDDRMLSAVWQDNELWTTASDACTPTGDTSTRDCLRLDEVSTSGTPSGLVDEDLSTSGIDEYYPAVSLSYSGDVFVSYTASSPATPGLFPGAYAVVSPSTSGTAFSAPTTIQPGSASYAGSRWGDYSAAAPDPSQPGAVWVGAEYAPSDAASGDWGTGAAELTLASSPAIAVAVEGTTGAMYVQAPALGLSPGWHSEGGAIAAPPAVVAAPNSDGTSPVSPLFFATGTNKSLYVRSLTAGWEAVSPHASCVGSPAAVVTSGTLTVACRGTTNQLYYNNATWSGTGLPVFTSGWKSLSGVLTAPPAVAPVGGVLSFFVRGSTGHIYIRTLSTGFAEQPWACLGAAAAAVVPSPAGETIFACEGTNRALYWAINGGAGWGPALSLGGVLVTAPVIAATSLTPYFLVEGTTHAVYERTPTSGYNSLAGTVVGGVGAAALN